MNEQEKINLKLATTLGIESAAQFYQELLSVVETNQPVVLSASAVESVDAAGLQLLTAFCRELSERNVSFRWQTPSEPLLLSAKSAGLSGSLQLPCAA